MFKPIVFANSLAATLIIFRVVAVALSILAPQLFGFSIRSLSLGLIGPSRQPELIAVITSILVPAAAAWVLAYTWATLYNKWSITNTSDTPKIVIEKTAGKKRSRKK